MLIMHSQKRLLYLSVNVFLVFVLDGIPTGFFYYIAIVL